jgi:hypothetical protein
MRPRYTWEATAHIDDVAPGILPPWLLTLVTAPGRSLQTREDTPLLLREGERNSRLFRIGSALRRYGIGEQALRGTLEALNRAHCVPPLEASEVAKIAASATRYAPEGRSVADHAPQGLLGAGDDLEQQTTFRRLRDFLAEPDETVNWVVDNMLPTGGLSLLGAKPKVGKSTLARYIGHCVASDVPCLSRPTSRGPVLYVSIEERRRDVRAHFGLLAGAGDLDLHVHVGPVPGTPTGGSREAVRRHRIAWLTSEIRRFRPVLVIIDTWGRFVAVKDGNDYAEATEASEPLIELARSSGTHLLFTHHAKKSEAELIDSLLGSVAIVGSVDTVLLERRQRDKTRTLESNQRVGDDLDETVLVLDKDTGTLRLAGSLDEARLEGAMKACLACLVRVSSATEQEIRDAVTGENELIAKALREAVRRGLVTRSGEGKAGKPYVYSVSRTRGETGETDKTDKHAQDGSRPLVRLVRENADRGGRVVDAAPQREPGEDAVTVEDALEVFPGASIVEDEGEIDDKR